MCKIYIVGNPNSGKTTLFNSLTRSSEHVGNWHGVTVDKKSKFIKFKQSEYEIVDLPGIYSLNAFSMEEQVSIDAINSNDYDKILYLIDANNFKRSMLLALILLTSGKNIKILINNYKSFSKSGGTIDIAYLTKVLGCQVETIDAKHIKPTEKFFDFSTRETAFVKTLRNEMKYKSDMIETGLASRDNVDIDTKCQDIEKIYKYILKIDKECVKKRDKIYGYSKFDKNLLKLSIFLPVFTLIIFFVIYFTFFLAGPILSEMFLNILHFIIQRPTMAILHLATRSRFVLALFEEGIFGACFSVLGFLPQICLIYLFLSVLEHSGLISRFAFLLDDLLQRIGLNGKMVYTLLMGFGCTTTATLTAKNMADKNSQIKLGILMPFISCSAKLPIYSIIGAAILGANSIWLIFGLYLLGIVLAVILAIVLERTILPTGGTNFVLEFPPIKCPQISNVIHSLKTSCMQFVVKVFGVIFAASVVLWLLSNINIRFEYVGEVGKSILFSFSSVISWMFKPIGLNNPNIICALGVGLVAKELILSSIAISNKVDNLYALGTTLMMTGSAINFNVASGISFLVFTLLYLPCISTFGVLIKEIGTKYTVLGVGAQFGLAYLVAWLTYTLIAKGLAQALIVLIVACVIVASVKIIYGNIKRKKLFCNCLMCNNCKNNQ